MKNRDDDIEVVAVPPSVEILHPSFNDMQHWPKIIELAGRTCYKSEDKITDGSAEKFVQMLIKRGHESVLEHQSMTVRFTISRAASHQLVRHRLCAFSQESQRYVTYKGALHVIVPNSFWPTYDNPDQRKLDHLLNGAQTAYDYYREALSLGAKAEDARYLLPNCTATEIVTTANLRQWRHMFKIRTDRKAQWEIRGVMKDLLRQVSAEVPCLFGDILVGEEE